MQPVLAPPPWITQVCCQVPTCRKSSASWMWKGKPETLNSGCWNMLSPLKILVTSEPDWVEVPQLPLSECWTMELDKLPPACRLKIFLSCIGDEGLDSCIFFVFKKRPPEPLALFIAWRCRDSWRYGCHTKDGIRPQFHCWKVQEYYTGWSTFLSLTSLFWASSLARTCRLLRIALYCFAFT